MKRIWHIFSAIKTFLIVTTGAIIGNNIINENYGLQTLFYFIIGILGYICFSIFEERIKNGN